MEARAAENAESFSDPMSHCGVQRQGHTWTPTPRHTRFICVRKSSPNWNRKTGGPLLAGLDSGTWSGCSHSAARMI